MYILFAVKNLPCFIFIIEIVTLCIRKISMGTIVKWMYRNQTNIVSMNPRKLVLTSGIFIIS